MLTLVGEDGAAGGRGRGVDLLDLRAHAGVHPRIGVVDVVPFVPWADRRIDDALAARDRFAGRWAGSVLAPCFLYGPERSLPDVRRDAFTALAARHRPAGAASDRRCLRVGARPPLVAYNVWLADRRPRHRAGRRPGAARPAPCGRSVCRSGDGCRCR